VTVVLDPHGRAVVFVGDGRGGDALKPFWKQEEGDDRLRPLPRRQALQQ
jgi:hypothetical protein